MIDGRSYCMVRYYYRPEYYEAMLKVIEKFKSLSYSYVTFQGAYVDNHVVLWVNGTDIPTTRCPDYVNKFYIFNNRMLTYLF